MLLDSLRNRLILAAALWVMFGVAAAGYVLSFVFKSHVAEGFRIELEEHLEELVRLTELEPGGHAHLLRPLSDPRYDVSQSGFYWEIQKDGASLARSPSLAGQPLEVGPPIGAGSDVHVHKIPGPTGALLVAERALDQHAPGEKIRFVIGTDERHLDALVASYNKILVAALSVFGLSLIAAASLLLAVALRPLSTLRASVLRLRSGESMLVEGAFPSEFRPLVDDLNKLLISTSDLIKRARTQAGNMAHGLRSSLTILADEARALEKQGAAEAAATILEECRTMETHLEYQIARTGAVALRAHPGIIADAGKVAADVASALARLHAGRGIAVDVSVPEDFRLAIDPDDLKEILANLVDNAFKHAASRVLIGAALDDSGMITIEDDGPGLPPEARDVVFNVGERWDSRMPGSGLGLAIVRDLAQLYGGGVTLEASGLGGLKAVLDLPLARLS